MTSSLFRKIAIDCITLDLAVQKSVTFDVFKSGLLKFVKSTGTASMPTMLMTEIFYKT